MLVWSRVYFYAIIGVTACSIFLVTPGKSFLVKKVKARSGRPDLRKNDSQESLGGATLGVPTSPGDTFDEMVDEIVEEVKRRRGTAPGPEGPELRKKVEVALQNAGGKKEL